MNNPNIQRNDVKINNGNSTTDEQAFLSMIENDQKFRFMMELSDVGIIVVQKGVIRESNTALANMCAYSMDEIVDTCLASFTRPDDIAAVEALCESTLKNPGAVNEQKATLLSKNGDQINVELKASACSFRQKPAVICMIKHIPQDLEARAEINNQRALESIAALSGGIAHDYNNLLTAIIGNITLARTYLDKDAKPFRLLDHALTASKTAKTLTQKLITFSKGGSPKKQVTAVDRLIKNAADFTLSGSNIKCDYRFGVDLRQINVDQSQIGQAIHNVVMNAREAMPQGGRITVVAENITVTDEPASLSQGQYVKISIADQGNGIAADEFEKIFDPYYSTKDMGNERGTGLGLSISRSIVAKHGGEVQVESELGVGTTFNIYLPAIDDLPLVESEKIEPDPGTGIFGEGKILVMDDDRMIRELAGEILQHLGYRVEYAVDGNEAVAAYRAALKSTDPFDAVILDLTVRGGMGGKEAIRHLKAIDPAVKGIVSSGYSEDPGITGFEKHGFCGVVAKPYSLEELGERLNQVLRG